MSPPLLQADNERIALDGSSYVAISTRNLERAVRFYERLFGFRVVERRREANTEHALLQARGHSFLAIHGEQAAAVPAAGTKRWSVAVGDLDLAREALWNRGIVPAAERLWSENSSTRSEERFIVIRDPDGHAIELVEAPPDEAPRDRGWHNSAHEALPTLADG